MSDIEEMIDLAIKMKKSESSLSAVTIYMRDKGCISSWLKCVTGITCGSDSFSYQGITGKIKTFRTYSSERTGDSEIIVAPCVLQSDLEKIEDSSSIGAVLVVPEMDGQCDEWLVLHSAINYQTGCEIPNTLSVTPLTNRCIGWLKKESELLTSLTNRSMEEYIKMASNILIRKASVSDYNSIVKQCLSRNLNHREAYIVAKILSSKKQHALRTRPNYDVLEQQIDDAQWEGN